MQGNVNYRQALTKSMALCSQAERCRNDIIGKLRSWELSDDEISRILDNLTKERFLDEERFVNFYINDKLRFNKWGKIKLTYMLRQKQIPEELIRSGLSKINDDSYKTILLDLLKTKVKSIKGDSDYERSAKLAVFAKGHGFEADLAFHVASQVLSEAAKNEV